ncbi:MAG: purine-nucleoside phosphorylase, partial [Coprobacillus sp.]
MSTPHNQASVGEIAKTVLMPGDPLRAKFLAENYLEDVQQFNTVRNMLGYTGTYKGKKVSIMGSGMGMPSIGIYSHELFSQYGVEAIIRIGSCGSFQENVHLRDVIIVQGSCTDSHFAHQYELPGTYSAISSYDLLEQAVVHAKQKGMTYHVGNVLASDIFYHADQGTTEKWAKMGCLGVEMESYALFATAAYLGKKALTL